MNEKTVLPDFARRTKPRVLNQLLHLRATAKLSRALCVHFVIDFIVGHSATTFPLGEHTQLNGVTEVWTSITADGAGTGAEKIKKKKLCLIIQ